MILGAEIAMLVLSLYALATGKLKLSKHRVVRGTPARLLGVVGLMQLPLAFCGGVAVGVVMSSCGQDPTDPSVKWILTIIEAGTLVFCLLVIYAVGGLVAQPPAPPDCPPGLEKDAIRSGLPARPGETQVPAVAVQGTVPLQTAAFFPGIARRQVDDSRPKAGQGRFGCMAWAALMMLLGIVLANAFGGVPLACQELSEFFSSSAAKLKPRDNPDGDGWQR
jgi:hypothetical protein